LIKSETPLGAVDEKAVVHRPSAIGDADLILPMKDGDIAE
jgi:hypothetical protein